VESSAKSQLTCNFSDAAAEMPRYFQKLDFWLGYKSLSRWRYSANHLRLLSACGLHTRIVVMINCILSDGRLFGLAPFEWSVVLASSLLCGQWVGLDRLTGLHNHQL
jgi:hypothetical protein